MSERPVPMMLPLFYLMVLNTIVQIATFHVVTGLLEQILEAVS